MSVTWAVQDNCISFSQYIPLLDALADEGIPYTTFPIVPFSYTFPLPQLEGNVIPYGSTSLMERLLVGSEEWKGFFCSPELFQPTRWIMERDDMWNQHGFSLCLEDLGLLTDKELFFRPNSDLKAFSGHVSTVRAFEEKFSFFDPNLEIFIHPVKVPTEPEERYFIVNRKVISGSYYTKYTSSRIYDLYHAQLLAEKWLPSECCVMDVVHGKVVEFNCINCSGFYDHDILAVVLALTDYVSGM